MSKWFSSYCLIICCSFEVLGYWIFHLSIGIFTKNNHIFHWIFTKPLRNSFIFSTFAVNLYWKSEVQTLMEKSTFLTPNVIYHKFRTTIDRNIQYVKEHEESVGNTFLLYPSFSYAWFCHGKAANKIKKVYAFKFRWAHTRLAKVTNSGLNARIARGGDRRCSCRLHSNRSGDSTRRLNRMEWTTNNCPPNLRRPHRYQSNCGSPQPAR